MLKQPLSVLEGEKGGELEDSALKLFYTIQQHAGTCASVFCVVVCALCMYLGGGFGLL